MDNTENKSVSNSTTKANRSEMVKNRSEYLLTVKKLLNDTEEQQKESDG